MTRTRNCFAGRRHSVVITMLLHPTAATAPSRSCSHPSRPACGRSGLSDLRIPWPAQPCARAQDYERLAREPLVTAGLLGVDVDDRAARRFAGSIGLDPHVYPYASLDRLLVVGAFSQWLFFLDDQYDDDPALGRDVAAARTVMAASFALLRGDTRIARTPFDRFTLHLRRSLLAVASAAWMQRFLGEVEAYLFDGSLVAMDHWSRDRVPSLAEYVPMRMYDSAVFPAFAMIELATGMELGAAELVAPALVEMQAAAVRQIALSNDLFSYQKEVLVSGTACNLVAVLMHEGSSFEQAVARAVRMLDAEVERFQFHERCLGASPGEPLRRYIAGMKAWMRGNLDFSLTSRRYAAPDSPFPELRAA